MCIERITLRYFDEYYVLKIYEGGENMKFPKGKGFDLASGVVVTVVLNTVVHDELVTLTGTFLGETEEKHHHKRFNDFHEFILIQLTCPFCEKGGPEIPEGTLVAINIEQILFTIPGKKCHDDKWCDKCHDKKNVINISCDRDDDDKCDDK